MILLHDTANIIVHKQTFQHLLNNNVRFDLDYLQDLNIDLSVLKPMYAINKPGHFPATDPDNLYLLPFFIIIYKYTMFKLIYFDKHEIIKILITIIS